MNVSWSRLGFFVPQMKETIMEAIQSVPQERIPDRVVKWHHRLDRCV